jgi:hypothetical protein
MFSKRLVPACIGVVLLTGVLAGPALAAKPTKPPRAPVPTERPLTPDEQAAADRKVAAAEAYLAGIELSGADLSPLSCPTPTIAGPEATTASTCGVPQGYLTVEARDQVAGHYCGPATGQVIANYAWAMPAGANKYTQAKLAGWMQTDAKGLTNAPELEDGLELGTQGAPRRPANWDWVVMDLRDLDQDGTTGDELQGFVRSNISSSKMPLAIPVKPHDPASNYFLVSWPKAVKSPGHWIAAYGWYGNFSGTTFARIYYTDSSKDEGGSTGKFWDPTRDIAALIGEHTRRIVW